MIIYAMTMVPVCLPVGRELLFAFGIDIHAVIKSISFLYYGSRSVKHFDI